MPIRRIEQKVPACRARMDLLREIENYIQNRSSEIIANGAEGSWKNFTVVVQDSLGSSEMSSVENLKVPLDPTTRLIRLDGSALDPGGEVFRITITFARKPALASCQMRLTGDTTEGVDTALNGMWHHLRTRIRAYYARSFVWRFDDLALTAFLTVGVILIGVSAVLF